VRPSSPASLILLKQQTARGGPSSRFLQQRIDSYRSDAGSTAGLK
jgi:hypothetical protein